MPVKYNTSKISGKQREMEAERANMIEKIIQLNIQSIIRHFKDEIPLNCSTEFNYYGKKFKAEVNIEVEEP